MFLKLMCSQNALFMDSRVKKVPWEMQIDWLIPASTCYYDHLNHHKYLIHNSYLNC